MCLPQPEASFACSVADMLHIAVIKKKKNKLHSHIAVLPNVMHHSEHDGNRAWSAQAGSYWLFQNIVNYHFQKVIIMNI